MSPGVTVVCSVLLFLFPRSTSRTRGGSHQGTHWWRDPHHI